MPAYVGINSIDSIFYGSNEISEVYKGSDLVFTSYSDTSNYIFRDLDSNGKLTLATGQLESSSNIKRVGEYGLKYAFYMCSGLSGNVSFPSLKSLNKTEALFDIFYGCSGITSAIFQELSSIKANGVLHGAFSRCTSLVDVSFPALKSTSFGNYNNQFGTMLSGVNGCVVHFPSNLQSVIGSWTDVVNGFGGTNTSVLFDLPATE